MQTEIIARGCRQACEFNAFVVTALNKTMLYIIYCDQRIQYVLVLKGQKLFLNLIITEMFFILPCVRSCHPRSHGLISRC